MKDYEQVLAWEVALENAFFFNEEILLSTTG